MSDIYFSDYVDNFIFIAVYAPEAPPRPTCPVQDWYMDTDYWGSAAFIYKHEALLC